MAGQPIRGQGGPDPRLLAVPSNDGLKLWDDATGQLRWAFTAAPAGVTAAFSPDGQRPVTGGETAMTLQPALVVWDYTNQRQLIGLQSDGGWTRWTSFSPDGNILLALTWGDLAELYRAPSWEGLMVIELPRIVTMNREEVAPLALRAEATRLAARGGLPWTVHGDRKGKARAGSSMSVGRSRRSIKGSARVMVLEPPDPGSHGPLTAKAAARRGCRSRS